MKKLLGNSCAKGCLAYVLAFVVVLVVAAMGLGGLKGKFSTNVQGSPPQATVYAVPAQPSDNVSAQSTDAIGNTGGGSASAASNPAPAAQATQPVQSVPQAQAAIQPTTQPTAQPKIQIQIQTQNGTISGDASLPFYVVQPNDTLWSIAQGFDVQVDVLRVVNSLTGDIIQPGQVIYLPQLGQVQQPQAQPQSPPAAEPQAQPAQQAPSSQQPGSEMPSMPQTGINKNNQP